MVPEMYLYGLEMYEKVSSSDWIPIHKNKYFLIKDDRFLNTI